MLSDVVEPLDYHLDYVPDYQYDYDREAGTHSVNHR